MTGTGVVRTVGVDDMSMIDAPISWRAFLICAFAAFGGLCKRPGKIFP